MLTDFIINGSLGVGNPLITFDGERWSFRMPKKSFDIIAKKGLEIFQSKENYSQYSRDFRKYMGDSRKNIIPRYKNTIDEIEKGEFIFLIDELKKQWLYYGVTEAIYHDLAHNMMLEKSDIVLKNNLNDLEKLKFEGREMLDAFMGADGVIDNVLNRVSERFSIEPMLIRFFYPDEIIKLFSGSNPSLEKIQQRKQYFVVTQIDGKICRIDGGEAKIIVKKFLKFEESEFEKSRNGLVGSIANKGIVAGRAVISPMLDIKAAMEVEKRMQKGDILIVQSTNPALIALCNKAGAIVTDQGGMLSHAAIISRELGIPCIVGTINGTKVFKEGDIIEVDANKGAVRAINK